MHQDRETSLGFSPCFLSFSSPRSNGVPDAGSHRQLCMASIEPVSSSMHCQPAPACVRYGGSPSLPVSRLPFRSRWNPWTGFECRVSFTGGLAAARRGSSARGSLHRLQVSGSPLYTTPSDSGIKSCVHLRYLDGLPALLHGRLPHAALARTGPLRPVSKVLVELRNKLADILP